MLKKLKWLIIIPGVLASAAQAQSTAQPTVADVVEKDLFEFHASPEDVAQKVFQSPEYKVNYLTNPSPSDEEKKLLIDSASILSNRAWFLRRMAKNEEPATKYLRDHGFIDKGKTEPSSAQKEKALSAQEGRLKKAVSDYNSLVANLVEKRGIPAPGSVVEEKTRPCNPLEVHGTKVAPASVTTAPAPIAKLANGVFAILHKKDVDDTKAASDKQVEAAKKDSSYIAPSAQMLKVSVSSDSAIGKSGTQYTPIPPSNPRAKTMLNTPWQQADAAAQFPEKVSVPAKNELRSLITDPNNPNTVYGISSESINFVEGPAINSRTVIHVLKSENGGNTWSNQGQVTSEGTNDLFGGFRHMSVSPDGKQLYLATDAGIQVSEDGGKTFLVIDGTPKEALDVKPSSDGHRLAVSYGNNQGVVIFDRDGGSWKKSSVQPAEFIDYTGKKVDKTYSVQFDPSQPDTLYAGTGYGFYRYKPATGWQLMKNVLMDSTVYNIEADSKGTITLSTCNGIYKAQSSSSNSPLVFSKERSTAFVDQRTDTSSPGYLRANDVAVNPADPSKIVTTSASGVYVSQDSGTTWKRVEGGDLPNKDALGRYAEFESATWLAGGAVEISGASGTYKFTP
jgi:hypothetical protein